jgi:hypothetical protein
MGRVALRDGRCVERSRSRSAKRIIYTQGASSTAPAHTGQLEMRVHERSKLAALSAKDPDTAAIPGAPLSTRA